ncbi:NAD/ferredoxin-dependent reductase-like protein [Rhizobium sp. BK251]|nr:FAD-dependent oxidoreductase [Rhizobium sp. BK251]TCL70325.1 NAD/ferredoxin-dependent reductase-like protein [Rhizobium sp. BK251]
MNAKSSSPGSDFSKGFPIADIPEGQVVSGNVAGEPALLVSQGGELFAIGATCTHYGGALAEGLLVNDTIRCPLHHACFNLRTGQVMWPPAFNDLRAWPVECRDGKAFVGAQPLTSQTAHLTGVDLPATVVIVGGGAAGNAAAETLRREGYQGQITMLSVDRSLPYDRPNLSKDYLAGTAKPEWMPLRSQSFYEEHGIDLRADTRVTKINPAERTLVLSDGTRLGYDALLLATGADPIRPDIPGSDLPHVRMLRTWADCDELIEYAQTAQRCVVIGAGFIGLECAAALRSRGLAVHVVSPAARPLEHVLGAKLGDMIRELHEAHGVVFHLGASVVGIDANQVTLSNHEKLDAELVVVGIGVRPNVALAKDAGLTEDRGVVVDEYLQTSAPRIYAAGDIARWPDPRTRNMLRIEHWVVAERQGVVAARNILGHRQRFDAVPFFWTQQYDLTVRYVGHAERWDREEITGNPLAHDCTVTYWQDGTKLAVATVGRDLESLRAEVGLEGSSP